MTELRERVLELLGSEDRALALGEILELLDEEGLGISPLRQILKELADESKGIALPEKTGVGGRPKLLYRAISERAVRSSLARADIEPEAIRDEQPTLYRQILEQSLGRYANVHPEERRRLFAETARRLRQENPAESLSTLCTMAEGTLRRRAGIDAQVHQPRKEEGCTTPSGNACPHGGRINSDIRSASRSAS